MDSKTSIQSRAQSCAQPVSGRSPGVAPSLTREQIVAAALKMGDEMGIENVSIRKLATHLGKAPMALYTYFSSIEDIRTGVMIQAFSEVDTHETPGERWDDTLRRTCGSIRQMYLRHARCHLYKIEGSGDSAGLEAHTRRVYALHERQGIPADILCRLWRVIDAYLGGFVVAETQEIEQQESLQATGDLPADGGSSAEGASNSNQGNDSTWHEATKGAYNEQSFSDGLDIIIAGIRALAAPDPCDWRSPA